MSRLRTSFLENPRLPEQLFFVDAVVADVFSKFVHVESEQTGASPDNLATTTWSQP
jgi:hypothetical protein